MPEPTLVKRTVIALVLALAAAPALAQTADESRCVSDDPDTQIAGCGAVIQSAQETPADQAVAYDNRSLAYRRKGLLDQAIADAGQAIALDPANVAARVDRGIAEYAKHAYDPAIADFTKAIALKPDNATVYNDRGNAYDDKGLHDLAIADYSHALVLRSDYAAAYANRASAYEEKKLNDYAVSDYRAALKFDPTLQPAQAGLKRLGGTSR
jgi:tetratricopeptide (TPR) repeat protein